MATKCSSDALSWFTHGRFGMFIHWGLYSLAARHEWVKNRECLTDEEYKKYFDHFCPDLYDPKDWARRAKEAGMKYVVITSKHHEGFCLWDSLFTEYKVTNTPWGTDLLKPFVNAFRDEGLRVGFYYSLLDWHHPEYPVDSRHPQRDNHEFRKNDEQRDVLKYAAYMRNQVEELFTQYGEISSIWFDFSFPGKDGKGRDDWESQKLLDLVRELQPDILVNNRLDLPGTSDFETPEQFQPHEQPKDENGNPVAWEGCQTFSGSWGYHRDENTWKSVEQLLGMLIDGVSKNGNLLLNVGPTARGTFDQRVCDRLEGIGQWMIKNERSIYGCGAAPVGWLPPNECRYTWNSKTKRLYLHFLAWPFKYVSLSGLKDKVIYAQILHDASEVCFYKTEENGNGNFIPSPDDLVLELPILKPDISIPVIELFIGN